MALLFSKVTVTAEGSKETFLISGISKEYDDLTASVQLEWFLQDIDSDTTVQVHADAYLYGEGEIVTATHEELCYFLDRIWTTICGSTTTSPNGTRFVKDHFHLYAKSGRR